MCAKERDRSRVGLQPQGCQTDGSRIGEEEMEFIRAINEYRKRHNRPFPTWSEVLTVLKSLGYRKSTPE